MTKREREGINTIHVLQKNLDKKAEKKTDK